MKVLQHGTRSMCSLLGIGNTLVARLIIPCQEYKGHNTGSQSFPASGFQCQSLKQNESTQLWFLVTWAGPVRSFYEYNNTTCQTKLFGQGQMNKKCYAWVAGKL